MFALRWLHTLLFESVRSKSVWSVYTVWEGYVLYTSFSLSDKFWLTPKIPRKVNATHTHTYTHSLSLLTVHSLQPSQHTNYCILTNNRGTTVFTFKFVSSNLKLIIFIVSFRATCTGLFSGVLMVVLIKSLRGQ